MEHLRRTLSGSQPVLEPLSLKDLALLVKSPISTRSMSQSAIIDVM